MTVGGKGRSNRGRGRLAVGAAVATALGLVFGVGLGSPTSVGAAPPAPATDCEVTASEGGQLVITWTASPDSVDHIVYRSVNGGIDHWRGRSTTGRFTDTDRTGSLIYKVASRAADGSAAALTTCTSDTPPPPPLDAPATCAVEPTAAGAVRVDWPAAAGADSYVISRSVNEGTPAWRGRTEELTFTDTNRADVLVYFVAGRSASGAITTPTKCASSLPPPNLAPPTSCNARTQVGNQVVLDWTPGNGADSYVVSRTVDGGAPRWRARTGGQTFTDTNRGGTIEYFVASRSASGTVSAATPCSTDPAGVIDLIAFGDMVVCSQRTAIPVAALADRLPGRILGLGDFSQEIGSTEQFVNCVDPIIGRHKSRIDPIPGNHEYLTPGAAPYYAYFGAAAGDPTKGYYERQQGNWHILFLNSNCSQVGGCGVGSPQYTWLADRLAQAPPGMCRIAVIHHPRWSSYSPYANLRFLDPFQSLLYEAGTDLMLSGHAHHYERMLPLNPAGELDETRGIRNVIVGTGGTALRPPTAPSDKAAVVIGDAWGVLDLDLTATTYTWRFVDTAGTVRDSGTEGCINQR